MDESQDIARFRAAVTPEDGPEGWFAAEVRAPVLIVPHANKGAYLDRYAQPDKGLERSEDSWPAPYWDIDVGFASLLILLSCVDEGLGACFFGLPKDRIDAYRAAFNVPERFRPIGAISIGYPDEESSDRRAARTPREQVVHHGRWDTGAGAPSRQLPSDA